MRDLVKKAINEWDPIQLLAITDESEYDPEIDAIVNRMSDSQTHEELADIIDDVFQFYFDVVFRGTKEDCLKVAIKIHTP